MKRIYCLMLLLCPLCIRAQSANLQPIKVGDKLPNISVMQMMNYKLPKVSLEQFKGKKLILDFWASWCGGCAKKFPILDSMQRQYQDSLQVLLVSCANARDSRKKIGNFFEQQKISAGKPLILPTVVDDIDLDQLFPHQYIPHYVWEIGR